MWRIGVSFQAPLNSSAVRRLFIRPVRKSIEADNLGIYSDYLMQETGEKGQDERGGTQFEHLVVFRVTDFKKGVDHLRRRFEELGAPAETGFFDMTESPPGGPL